MCNWAKCGNASGQAIVILYESWLGLMTIFAVGYRLYILTLVGKDTFRPAKCVIISPNDRTG